MTCRTPENHVSFKPNCVPGHKKQKIVFPRLIDNLFSPHSDDLLVKLIHESFHNLSHIFFDNQEPPEITELRKILDRKSHTDLLLLFILLLNIDADLKDKIMQMEEECRHKKLIRFFTDLKHDYIVKFLTNMNISLSDFVQLCRECYIQA